MYRFEFAFRVHSTVGTSKPFSEQINNTHNKKQRKIEGMVKVNTKPEVIILKKKTLIVAIIRRKQGLTFVRLTPSVLLSNLSHQMPRYLTTELNRLASI